MLAGAMFASCLAGCVSVSNYLDEATLAHAGQCPVAAAPSALPAPAQPFNIALSGGGYRAMLFHVGTLWRLHELGLLAQASHISSVSAGSITAAVLALQWDRIQADRLQSAGADGPVPDMRCFRSLVAEPLMHLADHTIDVPAVLAGSLWPSGAARNLESTYKRALFDDARLEQMPVVPGFIFNSTNLQSGAVWTFRRDLMGDTLLGYTPSGRVHIAEAVTASTAFPPFLSPLLFEPRDTHWQETRTGDASASADGSLRRRKGSRLSQDELDLFREEIPLVDGGVADNLGIEAVWDSPGALLISDGGGNTLPIARPATNRIAQTIRVLELVSDEPSELRAYTFIELQRLRDRTANLADRSVAYDRDGAYWDIGELPHTHKPYCPSPVDAKMIESLWNIETRLEALPVLEQKRLVNWGYHAADYALPYVRRLMTGERIHQMSARLPFPEASIFVDDKLQDCIAHGNWSGGSHG